MSPKKYLTLASTGSTTRKDRLMASRLLCSTVRQSADKSYYLTLSMWIWQIRLGDSYPNEHFRLNSSEVNATSTIDTGFHDRWQVDAKATISYK